MTGAPVRLALSLIVGLGMLACSTVPDPAPEAGAERAAPGVAARRAAVGR